MTRLATKVFTVSLAACVSCLIPTAASVAGTAKTSTGPTSPTSPTAPTIAEPSASAAAVSPGPDAQTDLEKLDRIQDLRDDAERAPDRSAGVSTDGEDQVVVNLADGYAPDDRTESDMVALEALGSTVTTRQRALSISELDAGLQRFTSSGLVDQLKPAIQSWGLSYDDNSVQIGIIQALSAAQQNLVTAAVGNMVTLRTEERGIDALSRTSDLAPFYGGDKISTPGTYCTSGFAIHNMYNTNYVVTAAHCGNIGTSWFNGSLTFGTMNFNGFQNGAGFDGALIGGKSYYGDDWIGSLAGNNSQTVNHAANSCEFCYVSYDGSFSGQTPRAEVASAEYTARFCDEQGNNCHDGKYTVETRDPDHQTCKAGDSGGPVIVGNGNDQLIAVGIIRAASATGNTCWYTQLPSILSYWTSTIN